MRCVPGFFPARRSGVVGFLLVLVLGLASLVVAPAGAAVGTLSGTVTLPGGAPSNAFTVEVYRRAADGTWGFHTSRYYSDWFNPSWVPGHYAMELGAGTYAICVDPHGAAAYECWDGAVRHGSADPVTLPDGGAATVDVQLDRVGAVQGRVLGPGSAPLPGVPVSAYYYDETAPDGCSCGTRARRPTAATGSPT